MLAPTDWLNITAWEWPGDVVAWAAVITAVGVIWRGVVWPGLKAFWAAVKAAPKIADGVGEVVELIEGKVLDKLDEMQVEMAVHQEQAKARDTRLDLHTLQLEDHEVRLGKLEQAHSQEPRNEG